MKIRGRVALVALAIAVPAVVATTALTRRLREEALLEGARALVLDRMEAGGREACEADPRRWDRRRGRAIARGRRPGAPPPPRMRFFAFDADLVPGSPRAPALGTTLGDAFRRGDVVALETVPRGDHALRRVLVAMPWTAGPCAVVLVEQRVPAAVLRPAWGSALVPLVVVVGVVLVVVLALGPIVARLRRLTLAVRRSVREGYAALTDLPGGSDEVGELAEAFDTAARELRSRYDELTARDEALTSFLANTTHDVMIPLSVLQGHLATMERATGAGRALDPTLLEQAIEETHYVGALLQNLRVAARLETGAPELATAPVDLGALVDRVVGRHRPVARQKGVALDHATPETPIVVEGDEVLLEQAIGNLVHNAIRYNHADGHVAVVLARDGGAAFTLRVVDDGPGIPEADLTRIRERGFRGDAARTRAPTGQGLGLHIATTVAARHGWALSFHRPAQGLEVGLRGPTTGASGAEAQEQEG